MILLWTLTFVTLLIGIVHATDQAGLSRNAELSNQSLLWGPYRPNLYFGIRPRIPKSLMLGLLWSRVEEFQGINASMLELLCSMAVRLINE